MAGLDPNREEGMPMLAETIRHAVETLQQQGQRISVRAVHALSGGSLRDVHRLLREVLPRMEGEAIPAAEVLPVLRLDEHPDVQAVRARLTSLAQAVEADAAAIVEQHLQAAYQEAVYTLDQWLRGMDEPLQRLRALQQHARREFPLRTILPHVEPIARPLQPYQPVGLEDLFYLWEHDRDVQRLLGDRA
jgi:Plasmid replication region DNA-binding N-term